MLPGTCEITDDIVAKIILEFLSRRHLQDTYNCFMREYQDVPYLSSENHNFLPQLEEILADYFTRETGKRNKKEEKIYALWKQFDIVASQLRSMTLSGEKAKAFLHARRFKNGISINEFEGIRSKQPKVAAVDKDVQTEPMYDYITVYTNPNDHEIQTATPCVYQQAYYTPQKEDAQMLHNENDALPSDQALMENKTPAKELLKAELTKEFKSPKRKTSNPKRRSNPLDVLGKRNTVTPLKLSSEETSQNNSDVQCVSPLLEKEDFTQMLKAMFSNSSFQEKLADNINKVAAGDLTTETGHLKDVEQVVKQTTDELDLSELYSMLGDLNHHNDDEKKQIFFPSENGTHSQHAASDDNEYNVHNQPVEQEHENIDTSAQNDELMKTAEQIILNDALEQQTESIKAQTSHVQPISTAQSVVRNLNSQQSQTSQILPISTQSVVQSLNSEQAQTSQILPVSVQSMVQNLNSEQAQTSQILPMSVQSMVQNLNSEQAQTSQLLPISTQSVVRNLNSDLGVIKNVERTLPMTNSNVTSTPLVTTRISQMFESQESYLNIEHSPSCVDLKTPTKVVYINKNLAKMPMQPMETMETMVTSRNEEQQPLHESAENIATDALLLLSTSPAKPPVTPQKEQFSFVKMLTDPLKSNFAEVQNFQYPVTDKATNPQDVLIQDAADSSNSTSFTVSDPTQLSEELPNTSNRGNKHGATSSGKPQRTFYEKPNKDVSTDLRTILPKANPQVAVVPGQVLQPVYFNIQSSPVKSTQNVYNQLSLQTSDLKYRQNERQRKSRLKKKNQKRQIVTRFLSFNNNTSQSTETQPPPSTTDTVGSDIKNLTRFFHFETNSPKQGAFSFDIPNVPNQTTSIVAASGHQANCSKITNASNVLPKRSMHPRESLKLPPIETIVDRSSCVAVSSSASVTTVKTRKKPKLQYILPHKEIDNSTCSKNENMNLSIIAHKSPTTLDTCSQDSHQCVSEVSSQETSVKLDQQKTINVKPCTGKSKNKKPMKVKFNFKSPKKKFEDVEENSILKTPARHQESFVNPPPQLCQDAPVKLITTPIRQDFTEHKIVTVPKFSTDVSFSLLQQDNTFDASDRISDLVLKMANEESIDLKIDQDSKDSNESLLVDSVGKKRMMAEDEDKVGRETKKRKKKHRTNLDKLKTVNVQELLSKIHSKGEVPVT